jgi:NAD(P)H-dependent flavin oxidoreductase YrpB (nitropropane dioxygenase family)
VITTALTRLLDCQVPLQQAGMGGVTTVELVEAVAGAGGIGTLPALDTTPLALRLDRLAARPGLVYGVNFLVPFVDPADVELAARRTRFVEMFYGDPEPATVARIHDGGALAWWQIGSLDEARAAVDAGCDVVVAQGVEAGGHVRGTTPLLPLLDGVLDALDRSGTETVPVVAGGGIATPRGVAAVLAAGAAAARIGTRFVTSDESCAHPRYKDALLAASGVDTVLTDRFGAGWPDAPHRVLRSALREADARTGDVVGAARYGDAEVPVVRWSPMPPTVDTTGEIDAMACYCGQGVDAVVARERAADVVQALADGAERLLSAHR